MRGQSVHEGGILINGLSALVQAAPKGSFIPQPHENTIRSWPSMYLKHSTFQNYLIFAIHKSIGSISPAPEDYIATRPNRQLL